MERNEVDLITKFTHQSFSEYAPGLISSCILNFNFQNQIYSPLPLLITSPTTEAMMELPLVPLSPCGKERHQVRSDE